MKIREPQSIEALAEFWDTHDLTDFMDELEEVPHVIFERQTEPLTIRLLPEEIKTVRQIAESQGTSQTALIRNWVIEKIGESVSPQPQSEV